MNYKNFKLYFKATRPWAFTASLVPVIFGGVFAYYEGFFHPGIFILTILGGVMVHGATNTINDYFDYMEGVDIPGSSTGMLVQKEISPQQILKLAYFCSSVAALVGVYFVLVGGKFMAALIIIGLLGSYGYTGRPFSLKYRALGAPLVFLMMGPLMVWGSYYIQVQNHSIQVILAALPIGLLVTAILHSNDLRDIQHDNKVGIKTLSMLLGEKKAKMFYYIIVHGAFFLIILYVVIGVLSPFNLITLITWPTATKLTYFIKDSSPKELVPVDLLTAKLHLNFGLIYALSITFLALN